MDARVALEDGSSRIPDVPLFCGRSEAAQRPWHADEYIGGGEFASGVLGGDVPFAEIYAGMEP